MLTILHKTALVLAFSLSSFGLVAAGAAATGAPPPRPVPVTRPGGLAAGQEHAVAGDCELAGVVCRPNLGGSCSNAVTTRTPPGATTPIRVLVRRSATAVTISTVPFQTYVQDVLPNEWPVSFDGDSRKAGAVAVKTYAWYWMSHFGGYLGTVTRSSVSTSPTTRTSRRTPPARPTRPPTPRSPRPGRSSPAGTARSSRRSTAAPSPVRRRRRAGPGANGAVLSQYGSQNCNDPDMSATGNTANKYNVILQTYYGSDLQLATTAQLRSQHDFQYLRRSTPATFSAGHWSLADGYPTTIRFGVAGDVPAVNTVGDGFARVGVFRPSTATWYLGSPTGHVLVRFAFGRADDVPAAGQYRGLGAPTQVAVFRPSTGTWFLAGPTGGVVQSVQWGTRGDVPTPGRWLDASTDSLALFRPSIGTWYVRGGPTVSLGRTGDIPVPADYTGDGITDAAVYRPSTNQFLVVGQAAVQWGVRGDVPVTGDFTGDGRADLAVYRPSTHTLWVRDGAKVVLPAAGVPIGAAPYRD